MRNKKLNFFWKKAARDSARYSGNKRSDAPRLGALLQRDYVKETSNWISKAGR